MSWRAEAVIRTSTGTTWTAANFGGTLPANGDTVIINSAMTGGPAAGLTFARFVVNTGFTFSHTPNAFTVSGDLVVNGTYTLNTVALTVSGNTVINGTMNDASTTNTGLTASNLFTGLLTINTGAVFSHTAGQNPTYQFRGGIVNNGIMNLPGTGAKTFSTTAVQSISGTGAVALSTVTIASGISLSCAGSGAVTLSGTNTNNGTLTVNSGSSLVVSGTLSNATASSIMNFGGNVTISSSFTSAAGSSATFANGTVLAGAGTVTLNSLSVGAGVSVTHNQTGAFTVSGTSTLDGTWQVGGATGLRLFTGLLTVNSGGNLSGAGNAPFEFRAGITNNGTIAPSGTGIKTFSTSQSISGSGPVALTTVTISSGITLTCSGSGAITLSGTNTNNGTLTLNTGSALVVSGTYSNATATSVTNLAGTITVSGTYSSAASSSTTFANGTTLDGGGAMTLATLSVGTGVTVTHNQTGAFTVSGASSLTGTWQVGSATGLRLFTGLLTVNSGGSLSGAGNAPFEFRAGITNNGTISLSGTGAKTFSTTAAQALSGSGSISISTITVNTGITLTNNNTGTTTLSGVNTITGTYTGGVGSQTTFADLSTLAGGGTVTLPSLSLGAGITVTHSQTGAFTVSGTTSLSGNWDVSGATGTRLFTGLLTVNSGASLSGGGNAPFEFRAGITNNGTISLSGTGVKTFSTANQALNGSGATSLSTITVNTAITLTNNNTGLTTMSGVNTVTGTYTGAAGSQTTFANSSTLTGAGTVTLASLSVGTGISVTHSQTTGSFTVSGATSIDGSWSVTGASGLRLFSGALSINAGGNLSCTTAATFEFRAGITNNGTLDLSGAGTKSFTTASQSLAGSSNILLANFSIASLITLTNNNTGVVTHGGANTITGTYSDGVNGGSIVFSGTLTISAGGILSGTTSSPFTFSGSAIAVTGMLDIGSLGTTAFTTTQTISGGGNVTFSTSTLSSGITLTISNTGIKQFYGNFTVPSTSTLTVSAGSGDLAFNNNLENAGAVNITGACPVTVGSSVNSTAGTITAGGGTFDVGESVNLSGAAIFNLAGGNFSVVNAINLVGSALFTDPTTGGTNTFGGLVTVGLGTTFSSTGTNTSVFDFRGGIACDGTVLLATTSGNKSFTSSNQNLTGSGNISIAPAIISAGIILTNLNSGTVTLGAGSTINGTYLDGDNAGTNILSGAIGITATGTLNSATTSAWNLTGLTLTNSGTLTLTGTGTITANSGSAIAGTSAFTLNNLTVPAANTFTLSNTVAKTISGNCTVAGTFSYTGATGLLTIGGNLAVTGLYTNGTGATQVNGSVDLSGTGSVNFNNGNFTAGSTFTMSGTSTISDAVAAGTNTFIGLVTVGSGCSFSNAAISIIYDFRGGITNNGTFSITGGTCNFTTSNQVLQGNPFTISTTVVGAGITVSSSGAVQLTFGATLTLNGNVDFTGAGTTTLNGTNFSGAGNAIFQTLSLNGGTNTQAGTMTVLGTTSVVTASHAISATAGQKTFTGLVSIPTALTLSSSSTAPLQFLGGITATGTFTQSGTGNVTFTGNQTIDGSGAVTFAGAVTTTGNLFLSKPTGTITFTGSITTGDTLYLISTTTCAVNGVASLAALNTIAGTTLNIGGNNFTVNGGTTLGGLMNDVTNSGTNTFTGALSTLSTGEIRQGGAINSPWIFGGDFNNAGLFNISTSSALATISFNGNLSNTGTFSRSGGAAAMIFNNNISFTSNSAIATSGGAGFVLTVNGNLTMDFGANNFTQGVDLAVNSPGSLTILSTGAFTVTGASTITGTLNTGSSVFTASGATTISGNGAVTDGNDAGSNTFNGAVTLSSATASFTSSANSLYSFASAVGITNAGTVNLSGTGTVTFNNSQTLSGAGAFQFQNFTVPATRTLTISATGTKSVSGDVTNNGSINHSATSGTLAVNGSMNNSGTLTGGAAPLTMGVYTASGNFTNGTGATTVNGAVSLSGSANINMNTGNFSALSTTTLSGTSSITDGSASGSNLFAGLLTINSGCSFTNTPVTGATSNYEFRDGIVHDGTNFSLIGNGINTFSTNNQSLSGASSITVANVSIAGINLTNSNASATGVTISTTCTGTNGSSQWTQGNNSILNFTGTSLMPTGILTATASGNTVNFNGAAQNINGVPYFNLGCLGSNTKTLTSNLTCSNDLNIISGVTFQAATFNVNANTITCAGAFSKSGAGSVLATGSVTLNGGGLFTGLTVGNPSFEFQGGIVQNSSGNSVMGSGTAVFSTNNQSISGIGAGTISFGGNVTINGSISLTNQKTVSITGNLDGSSGSSFWNNDNGSVLNYGGAQLPFNTAGSLIASTNANTVNYNGANQTIRTTTYHNLGILGSGTKTLSDVTINGNFSHTAATLTSSGTQTFAGPTAATITTSTTPLSNLTLNKTGSSVTLAGNLSISNALTLTSGTFSFGAGSARTLTAGGDMSGSGTVDMSGLTGHTLVLNGENNTLGTYSSVAGSIVTYSRAGNQTVFSSPNYRRLNLSGSGTKSLSGEITVNDTVSFTADILLTLGSYNMILAQGSRLRAGAAPTTGTFGVNRMIVAGGSGALIRRGTSAASLAGFSWSSTGKNTGLFPVGTTSLYSPAEITSLTATVSGTGSISVNAIATKLPAVPFFFNSLAKYWDLTSSNLSGISANMRFTYNNPAEVVGNQSLYVPRVWDGSSLSAPAGASAIGSNPISTTGSSFITGQWTAVDVTPRNAYYSYISGEWNDPNIWTTDPSGSTRVNEKVPEFGDQVFILNGDTISNLNGDTVVVAAMEVENGAVLDLGSVTGHTLGPVSGAGIIRLKTTTIPAGNYIQFVASTGGTMEYYDLPAGTNVLNSGLSSYNNLRISNKTGTSFTLVQNHNLTLNGSLSLSATSTGNVNYQLSNTASSKSLSVGANLSVSAGCSLTVGTDNAAHTLAIAGNFTNSGFVRLTNSLVNASTPTNGYCNTTFTGPVSNTLVQCNSGSQTRFHNLINQKNTGYELLVQADAGASPQFWAPGRDIDPQTGTLRLGANVNVTDFGSTGGNFDLGSSTTLPTIWIDGATVTFAGSEAIVGYGTLKITAGTLNCGSGQASIVLREGGQLLIDGGTVNAAMFRTSNTATTHRGAYIQSGGTLNLTLTTGSPSTGYSMFTLPYAENVFKMSGGVINITKRAGSYCGGIQIGSTTENFDVTGGTINVITSTSTDFEICSRAPFYNLNISRGASSTTTVVLRGTTGPLDGANPGSPAVPLVLLNDLTINGANGTVFNTLNSNVTVGGNLNLNSGATWQAGTNTLIFNGSNAQTFTINGTLGLSSMQVNKLSGSTVTLAGSAASLTLTGGLQLNKGVLADGGKTINVPGNVFSEATHSGAGKIVLNGTAAAQTISGTTTATFGNLELNNTFGATGSTQVTSATNIRINGNLTLTSNRLFSIGKYELSLSGASLISGTFSSNRYISTTGLRSDAGIKKTFSSTAAVSFPFGSGGNYTPATIQFSSAPSAWGTLDVRPAATKQLYVTSTDAYDLYWRIKTTGFSGIPASSVNYTFNYGNLVDNTSYIPAYYDDAAISYTPISDVNQVDEASNNILFTGVSYTDGDYTAGDPSAFGTVTPFYSRANGNWNTPSTWSNTGFGGTAATGIPASNSPVLIGNGSTFNHTVTVTANNTISGSLIVDAGSTLDIGTTTGNNFGAIPYATAGGSGRIRISSATASAVFPAGDFGLFFLADGGTTEFYSSGTQDFVMPSLTDAPNAINIDTYRNLVVNPGAGRVIAMPEKNLLVYGNVDMNGSSSGRVRLPNAAARTQTIKGNMTITSGILEFPAAFSQTLNLEGNANILSNGTMQSVDTGSVVHTMVAFKNMVNEGNILFNRTSKVNLRFQSDSGRSLSGSNPSANLQIGQMQVVVGTSPEALFDITAQGSMTAPNDNWLTITRGTLRISCPGNLTLTSSATNFTVPAAGGLIMNNSGLTITVGDVNSAAADLVLGGNLYVLAGTLNIGNAANNQNNDLEYANAGLPEFKVAGNAVVNINGQIRRSINTQQGALIYTQQDNSTVLVRGKNTDVATSQTYDRAKFEILNPGSQFNMSGNSTLTIDRSGTASGVFFDIYIQPTTYSVTGGTINIGTSSTPASQTFIMNNIVPVWNMVINGTTNPKTLTLNGNSLVCQDDLQILGNSILNTSGQNVTVGGDFVNQNSTSTAGLAVGGYRPVNSTQVTTLNGSLAAQNITGATGNLTNFANLVFSNTAPSGSVTLGSNTALRVSGNLEINSGQFNTEANLVTITGNLVNSGGHTSSGAGTLVLAGSNQQFVSSAGTASFGSLRITNAAGVDAQCPTSFNGTLNITTGIFYISNYLMSLSSTSAITGSFSSACMIRLNGVASDAGVVRNYPASASDFTFPIGVTLKYTPVRVNVTSNSTAGTVNVKPINVKHPATTDTLDKELTYYWKMSSTGFSGSTVVSHTFTYSPDDAANGNENNYVTGRFLPGIWAPTQGIAGTVSPANDRFTLTAVNYFDGDYTAGEPSEFNILTKFFSRSATLGGNWSDPNSWSNDEVLKHSGAASLTFPNFNQVVIDSTHTITVSSDNFNAVSVELKGTLDIGNTIGHNFGTVSGRGKLISQPTAGNQYIFPGGDFLAFVSDTGGTFEYSGTANGTLPTQATYNHLTFNGSGTKSMPNANVRVNGNFRIETGVVSNPSNRTIFLRKDWINLVGTAGFAGGTGTVVLEGVDQLISGSTTFGNLTLADTGNKTIASTVTIGRTLTLTAGILVTGGNQLTISASPGTISGGSSASYINGTLTRGVAAASPALSFPVGDAAGYSPVSLSFTGSTTAGGFISASATGSEHPQIYTSGIHPTKNTNRYWTLSNSTSPAVGGFTAYAVTINHIAAESDTDAVPASFVVARRAASAWTLPTVGTVTSTSVQATGISGTSFGDFVAGLSVGGKIWTGASSSDWNLAGNWTPSGVPTATENALVGPVTNLPGFLTGSSGVCKSLLLLSGAGIDVPSGYQLSVGLDAEATGNTITGAGTLRVSGNSTLRGSLNVNSNLEIAIGSTLGFASGAVLNLGGNLTVNGSMSPGTAQVSMVGNQNTTISGNAAFYNLTMNKAASSNTVQLLSNVSVANNLDMQVGNILLNGNDLDLGVTGTLLNETDVNKVGGPGSGSIRATRVLNAPSAVNVAGLGMTITSAANMGSTQIIRRHDQIVYGLGFGINRRVEIHPTNNTALNATLTMAYYESELNTPMGLNQEIDLDLWRFNGSSWDDQNGILDQVANTVTKTGIPQFSEWIIASEVNAPLPLNLAYARVDCELSGPVLRWRALGAKADDQYSVQVSSDGRSWQHLSHISASDRKGDGFAKVLPPVVAAGDFVRIKVQHADGSEDYSSLIPVNCSRSGVGNQAQISPNPGDGFYRIFMPGSNDKTIAFKVINSVGQMVLSGNHQLTDDSELSLDLRQFPAGIYRLQLIGDGDVSASGVYSLVLK